MMLENIKTKCKSSTTHTFNVKNIRRHKKLGVYTILLHIHTVNNKDYNKITFALRSPCNGLLHVRIIVFISIR